MSIAVLGCGGEPASPPAPDLAPIAPSPPEELSEADAYALPLDRLRALEDATAALAGPTPEGVRAARRAARYARVRALREPESEALSRALELLEEAGRRRAIEGACDASLDRARLLASDAAEPREAWVVAYRAARRFGEARDAACATALRRLLGTLDAYRADAALIAAIDADPDADDPSVALGAGEASPSAWAARRAGDDASSTLHEVRVQSGVDEGDRSARVVLAFDHVARFETREVAAADGSPARFVVEAHAQLGAGVSPSQPIGRGGLRAVRSAADGALARVELDLEDGASARLWLLPEPFRLVVDVSARAPSVAARRRAAVIVLDPGHGGADYGTRVFGLEESDIALDLALRAREALRRRMPDARVVLTRDRDVFVSLEQRAAMANAIEADLFVSIHLNAAEEPVDRGGVTTFVLDTSGDRQALLLAARENGTRPAEVGELSLLIASLQREEQLEASRALAESVHRETLRGGRRVFSRLHDRGVRSAAFYVLVGATMPAILLEASFLTREDEARMLATEPYRQALADGIAEGIARFAAGD